MPIVITPAAPYNLIGAGIPMQLKTDVTSIIPTGSTWQFNLSQDDNGNNLLYTHSEPFQAKDQTVWPFVGNTILNPRETDWMIKTQDPVYVQARIETPTNVVDQGEGTGVWEPTTGLPFVIQAQGQAALNAGFNVTDRNNLNLSLANTNQQQQDWQQYTAVTLPSLQDALNNIVAGITVPITTAAGLFGQTIGQFLGLHSHDTFGVFSVTGGTTCETIDWTAGVAAYWGAEVQIDSAPDTFSQMSPDGQWTPRDLAVLRIYLNDDLILRHGVHLWSHVVTPLPATFPLSVGGIGVPVTPPNYRIVVNWAPGVCGQLLLTYLPD